MVNPAQPLTTIVPDGGRVMIEAMVENRDIGFVHLRQDVRVRVETFTFTFTRYGLMKGHVVDVSRDASPRLASLIKWTGTSHDSGNVQDTGMSARYEAHVILDGDTLLADGQEQRLAPGLSVTAEIKTGRRSVIDYLVSPIARYVHGNDGKVVCGKWSRGLLTF